MPATGAIFAQVEERGETDTGRILATSDEEMRKMARPESFYPSKLCLPGTRVAVKIGPDFIVGLGSGPATACGLRFVRPNFLTQRPPFLYVGTP